MKVLHFTKPKAGLPDDKRAEFEAAIEEIRAGIESGDIYEITVQTGSETEGVVCRQFAPDGFESHMLLALATHWLTILLPFAVDWEE